MLLKSTAVCIILLIAVASIDAKKRNSTKHRTSKKWLEHRAKKNMSFVLEEKEVKAFKSFEATDKMIEEHNDNANSTYTLGHNDFSHWNSSQLKRNKGLRTEGLEKLKRAFGQSYSWDGVIFKYFLPTSGYVLKKSVDWVQRGWNTPVRMQGGCGDCWAFATTASLEGYLYVKNKVKVVLSPQQLTDCSFSYGNNGCNGGMMYNAYKYINKYGICQESYYPFVSGKTGTESTCSYNNGVNKGKIYKVSSWVWINQGSDEALMEALDLYGPIAVGIDASADGFQYYRSGIYASNVGECTQNIDHAVTLTGYGVDSLGRKYWTIKNQWDTTWGNKGYMNISRDIRNNCAISSYAMFPIVV